MSDILRAIDRVAKGAYKIGVMDEKTFNELKHLSENRLPKSRKLRKKNRHG